MPSADRPRPAARRDLRADAERNRQQILAAAKTALEASDEVTMQALARCAGVGQGTLYRHFPTREDLLIALYRDEFDTLLATAGEVLQAHRPLVAMRLWLNRLADFGRTKSSMASLLGATIRRELHEEQLGPVSRAIEGMLSAGRASGEIRPDLTAHDVLALGSFLWLLDPAPEGRLGHLLDVLLDGLRRPAADREPHDPRPTLGT